MKNVRQVYEPISNCGRWNLINNAGLAGKHRFLKEPEVALHQIIESNLTGPVLLVGAVVKYMIEKEIQGSIINLCSTAAYSLSSGSISYCIAKAGLLIATKSMALKFGPHKIRVNSNRYCNRQRLVTPRH